MEVSLTKPSMSRSSSLSSSPHGMSSCCTRRNKRKSFNVPNSNMVAGRRGSSTGAQHHQDQRETAEQQVLSQLSCTLTHTHIRRRKMLIYWLRSEYRWVRVVSYLEVFIILTILRGWVFPEGFGSRCLCSAYNLECICNIKCIMHSIQYVEQLESH